MEKGYHLSIEDYFCLDLTYSNVNCELNREAVEQCLKSLEQLLSNMDY